MEILETGVTVNDEKPSSSFTEETSELKIWTCQFCAMEEKYDYKGTTPPFAKHLCFVEECYIMKDPFSAPNRGEILVLGSDCSICCKSACIKCSIFYTKRFCKKCALDNIKYFPVKLQKKIKDINDGSSKIN